MSLANVSGAARVAGEALKDLAAETAKPKKKRPAQAADAELADQLARREMPKTIDALRELLVKK